MYFSSSIHSFPITDAAQFFSQKDKKEAKKSDDTSESSAKMKVNTSKLKKQKSSN